MTDRIYNVLFLCAGNSARSILAEAILSRLGAGRFRAYSAASHPKGQVHPMALKVLREFGYDTSGFRSKSWDEFAKPGAPALDFVPVRITHRERDGEELTISIRSLTIASSPKQQ